MALNGSSPNRVAVFTTNFGEFSQTFVHTQLTHHERYEAEVFCWRQKNPDRFPFEPVHTANPTYGFSRYSPAFARRVKADRFGLVHAHFGTGAIYALPYAKRAKLPFVVTFHGYDVPLLWNLKRFRPDYWPFLAHHREMLERMTMGLCCSRELLELLVAFGVDRRKLRHHQLGIDVKTFSPPEAREKRERPVILMVGRFVEKKGFAYGVRGFAEVADRAELWIVGDGAQQSVLESVVDELRIGESVRFLGRQTAAEVFETMAKADVLIAPSVIAKDGDRDSGLIVAKEAGAMGLPVVGSYHGGIHEIIDEGVTGFLAPERSATTIGAHLARLVDNPELRAKMGAAAQERIRTRYSIERQIEELEGLYDEARSL